MSDNNDDIVVPWLLHMTLRKRSARHESVLDISRITRWRWTLPCPYSATEIYRALWSPHINALLDGKIDYSVNMDGLIVRQKGNRSGPITIQCGGNYVTLRQVEHMATVDTRIDSLKMPQAHPLYEPLCEWAHEALKVEDAVEAATRVLADKSLTRGVEFSAVVLPGNRVVMKDFIEGAKLLPEQEDTHPSVWVV